MPRVLVRGESSVWLTVVRVLAPLAVVIGVVLVTIGDSRGWFALTIGIVLSIGLESYAVVLRRLRTWVEMLPDGFVLIDRTGTRTFRDEQVTAVAIEYKRKLNNGLPAGFVRTFRAWTSSDDEPVVMTNRVMENQFDPLQELIDRLVRNMAARMDQILKGGGSVSGNGWRLADSDFTYGPQTKQERVPLSAIVAVEEFEESVCLWRSGRDDAFAKVPLNSRNARFLPKLIGARMAKPGDRAKMQASGGLGRMLFEKRPFARWFFFCGCAVGLLLISAGILLILASTNAGRGMDRAIALVLGVLLTAFSVACVFGIVALGYRRIRCYEHGVYQAGILGERVLAHQEIGSLQFGAMRHYHDGIYHGGHVSMKFIPVPGTIARPIHIYMFLHSEDDDVIKMRDMVANYLADRMIEKLAAKEMVPWTRNLAFTPEGIQYRPADWFSRGEPEVLKYDEYDGYVIDMWTFKLLRKNDKKPVAKEGVTVANFLPGFYVLLRMSNSGPHRCTN